MLVSVRGKSERLGEFRGQENTGDPVFRKLPFDIPSNLATKLYAGVRYFIGPPDYQLIKEHVFTDKKLDANSQFPICWFIPSASPCGHDSSSCKIKMFVPLVIVFYITT